MNKMFKKIFGWECSSFDIYQQSYYKFGGSVNTHPKILQYLLDKRICKIDFYHYKEKGAVQGCFFEISNKIGVDLWRTYPITSDEIILPVNINKKIFLPGRSNKISSAHSNHFYNTIFTKFRPKKKFICLAKDDFSKKSHKNRRNEFNKFIKEGGAVKNVNELQPEQLANIYVLLFKKRFQDNVKCYSKEILIDFFTYFKDMIFGYVLFIDGSLPCAYDFILKAESDKWIYFDVPNGGVDPDYSHLSVGSILMWLNINEADKLCNDKNKKRLFSIGLYDPKWDYKTRWCNKVPVGKTIFM